MSIKTKKSLLLFLIAFPMLLSAQLHPQIINVDGRTTHSLNGLWFSIVDPFENGYYDYRRLPNSNGFGVDSDYVDRSILQEYEFETDRTLFVPGDWNTQRSELYYYEGTVWYRKRFGQVVDPNKRYFLHFGAVNYEAIVFLNGKEIGKHIGGFTPFNFEVTELIRNGQNSVVVKVDNKRSFDAVPTINSDWWNYGGITRAVHLVETPKTFVRDYYLQLKKSDTSTLSGWVQLDGAETNKAVNIDIPELKIRKTLVPDKNGYASFEIKAKPMLWSPENPKLYKVNVVTNNELIADEIGFRTIETQGNKILLNGKSVFLRGICIHEESAFRNGRIVSNEENITLLQWAKDMGCNFVRLAHYPHNEQMVRQAEKMGLMVWSEIPVYWTIEWTNAATYANAESQLVNNITRDKNRAAIVIWSIANETPHGDERFKFLSKLAGKVRQMDNVRLVSAALEKDEIGPGLMSVKDELTSIMDVLSFNQYIGWYDGMPAKCDSVNWVFNVNKPVIVSEFGADALYNLDGKITDKFSEDYQEDLYIRTVNMMKRMPGLAGCSPWILKDFRSPRRQLRNVQDEFNRKGLVSDRGEKKRAFFVMQKWYQELMNQYK